MKHKCGYFEKITNKKTMVFGFLCFYDVTNCKHLQQHPQRKSFLSRSTGNCLPDLGGGVSGFAVVLGLGSNCFGDFESEGKRCYN